MVVADFHCHDLRLQSQASRAPCLCNRRNCADYIEFQGYCGDDGYVAGIYSMVGERGCLMRKNQVVITDCEDRFWPFAAISVGENYTYLIAAFRLEAELGLVQLLIAANDPKPIIQSTLTEGRSD